MKNHILDLLSGKIAYFARLSLASVVFTLMFGIFTSHAQEPNARIVTIENPIRSNGIHIGDVLERKVLIETSQTYQLSRSALPMKGSRQNGIELTDIQIKSSQKGKKSLHEIALSYQVFASAPTPTVMQLPIEVFALTGGEQALSVELPKWRFWFSPLVSADITSAKNNLQPQHKPSLIDTNNQYTRLAVFLGLLVIGLFGLTYVNADRRWLPFMGGAFAQAHRHLKKLPKNADQEKTALFHLHQAFNQVHGANLFAADIEQFIEKHPKFRSVKADIETFFDMSNKLLFTQSPHDHAKFINDLVAFSRNLRNCERGVA